MAPLAVMLKQSGYTVSGSDKASYPPMGQVLADAGIEILEGFSADHLDPLPDVVVIGNAVSASNPEAAEVERLGLPRLSFPEAVARYFLRDRRSLVVAGTHGKTTTTGMLARVLEVAGEDPGYLVGGLVRDLGGLARPGRTGAWFAIEGDEYDSAYFDKGPKFVHYQPAASIITSVEFDHADIYRDVEHVKSSFARLVELLPEGAPLVVCGDYPHLLDLFGSSPRPGLISYGCGDNNQWRPAELEHGSAGSSFRPSLEGELGPRLQLRLHGSINVLNALAVFVLSRQLGISDAAVAEALAGYRGAARRQELVGSAAGVDVIDDFAHHPTAVAGSLAAMADAYNGRKVWAVFEPRSNTSRRSVFQARYTEALALADRVVLSEVFHKENDTLAEGEALDTEAGVEELNSTGTPAWQADGPDAILDRLPGELRAGDVVLCMSNGAFGDLPRRLLAALGG